MYRKIEEELKKWKEDYKMPLMLVGARQTGKTYILENFCKNNFNNYIYINLDKEENIREIFEETIDPETIIEKIEIVKNVIINPLDTIIFFDEIQVSERAITSLKYFCESDEPYKIVCAGSLLGVKINRFKSSFPVGKVTIKYLYPMDFEEYLIALGEDKLISEIKTHYESNETLMNPIHEKALDLYKKYLLLGVLEEDSRNSLRKDKLLNKTKDFMVGFNKICARYKLVCEAGYDRLSWNVLVHASDREFCSIFVKSSYKKPYQLFNDPGQVMAWLRSVDASELNLEELKSLEVNKELVDKYEKRSKGIS